MTICPECNKTIREKDTDTKAIWCEDEHWHRVCYLKHSGEYALMLRLLQMQDDPDIDPTTAMADLIGDFGHFSEGFNKGKKRSRRIDFEDSMRRALNYYHEEVEA